MTGDTMRGAARAVLVGPWSARTWQACAHLLAGFPLGLLTCFTVVLLGGVTTGLLVTFAPALVTLAALLWCVRGYTALQRDRFATLLGVVIDPPAHCREEPGRVRRLLAEAAEPGTWRQFCYHLLAGPLGVVGFVVTTVLWTVSTMCALVSCYAWALPADSAFGRHLHTPSMVIELTVGGLLVFHLAPFVTVGLAAADTWLARTLLGPTDIDRLRSQLVSVTQSRNAVLAAADAERSRIERDLHDGTQQRLTALAINLGIARQTLPDLSGPAREVIEQAHEETKQVIAELRGFVRGLHPAVLSDRGLDAALSGVVARSPVRVRLSVDVSERPSPTVESVAYFVVSEALTNISKHAEVGAAEVTVARNGATLRLVIADAGRGGADEGGGTGLRGLTHRVASVGGSFRCDSPVGGGTTIEVELPCES
ncbi:MULTISPECIES: sensor histidine kinase [Amycolatopsis]|uniref:histidine kinase n=3 Tax=Amycolatopsis TaxID=1813 RepID=A0ABW5I820_9PSEU